MQICPIPDFTSYIKKPVESSIYLYNCEPSEIENFIKELSSNKSSDISITVLQRVSVIISPILSKFYNIFMSTGIFPKILKIAIVSPIYKKEEPQKNKLEKYVLKTLHGLCLFCSFQ